LLLACPPTALRRAPAAMHEDLIHDVVVHCCTNDFRVLRTYRGQSSSFAAWFSFVARNRILDYWRKEKLELQPSSNLDPQELLARQPANLSAVDHDVWAREVLTTTARCLTKLSPTCQVLLKGASEGLTPKQLTRLLGWPAQRNKKASDDLRACRDRLRRLLSQEGIDPQEIREPS